MSKGTWYTVGGIVLRCLGILGAIAFYVIWYKNPELSLMQMLMRSWWFLILSAVFGFAGGFLSSMGKHTD